MTLRFTGAVDLRAKEIVLRPLIFGGSDAVVATSGFERMAPYP